MKIIQLIFFLALFTVTSCEYFSFKNPINKPVVELDSVDFSKVDEFPIFPDCDSIPSVNKQRICFQIGMSKYIYQTLDTLKIRSKTPVNDTLIVKIKVDKNGFTNLSSIKKSELVSQQLPKIDTLIATSLKKLPKMQPALKRGIPVDAEFSLPIILKTD